MGPLRLNALHVLIRIVIFLSGGRTKPALERESIDCPVGRVNGSFYRWLYCLFLAIDANFRLKLKARGIKDPEVGSGLAYFVDVAKFQQHLKHHADEQEVSASVALIENDVNSFTDRNLWGRIPCSKPGKFTVVKGLFGFRRRRSRLSPRSGPQERCS